MNASHSLRLAGTLLGCLVASVASAQATRTWVSGVGDDANPCSRTAPCLTFAGALPKTAPGGEIDALDPGNFGPVTIDRAITIDGKHPQRSGQVGSASDGITVAAGAADLVLLRNLGVTGGGTGVGVRFVSGAGLQLERCTVTGFGDGVAFTPAAGGRLDLSDVELSRNSSAAVRLGSGDPAHPTLATLSRARLGGNGTGLVAADGARAVLYDAVVAGSSSAAILAVPINGGTAEVNLEGVVLTSNAVGVQAGGASGSALVRLSKVVALDGGTATSLGAGARLLTFGNNRIAGLLPGACSADGNAVFPQALAAATLGAPFSAPLTMTNGIGQVAFSLTGTLPPGLAFAHGTIAGTPTLGGTYAITAQAVDANGCTAHRDYQLAVPDVTLATSTDHASVSGGGSATVAVSLAPVGGYTGGVALSCANLPAGATCTFDPAQVTLGGGPATAMLTISASRLAAGALSPAGGPGAPSRRVLLALLAGSVLLGLARAPRTQRRPSRAAFAAAVALSLACGGSSGHGGTTQVIQVVATPSSGAPAHQVDVTLTLAP